MRGGEGQEGCINWKTWHPGAAGAECTSGLALRRNEAARRDLDAIGGQVGIRMEVIESPRQVLLREAEDALGFCERSVSRDPCCIPTCRTTVLVCSVLVRLEPNVATLPAHHRTQQYVNLLVRSHVESLALGGLRGAGMRCAGLFPAPDWRACRRVSIPMFPVRRGRPCCRVLLPSPYGAGQMSRHDRMMQILDTSS